MVLLSLTFIPRSPGQSRGFGSGGSSSNSTSAVAPARLAIQALRQVNSNTYQGSIVKQAPVAGGSSACRWIRRSTWGCSTTWAWCFRRERRITGAQQLQQLQALLPTVTASAKEAVQQTNLQAEGLKIPGFPAIIGPYGYTDVRGSVSGRC